MERIGAIILAGGQGTRLFPLTLHRAKPALSFGGRYRLIDIPLSHCINSGIKRVFVLTQFLASSLTEHILSAFPSAYFFPGQLEILGPEEAPTHKIWSMGTADAARQHIETLLRAPVDYFIILSGDQVYNWDLKEFVDFAREKDVDLVIASTPVKEKEAKRMGLLKVDKSYFIQEFYEKPQEANLLKKFELSKNFLTENKIEKSKEPLYLGSMGIYLFKKEALVSLLKEKGDDFGRELLPFHITKKKSAAFVFQGYWEDIGTVASYYFANLALISQKSMNFYDEQNPIFTTEHFLPSPLIKKAKIEGSILSEGSILEECEVSNSVIGLRMKVGKKTKVKDSVIMGNHFPYADCHIHIGERCELKKCIIDEHVIVGNKVKLINKKRLKNYDGNGIYIRDGIIIVTAGTRLPDGFSF